MAPSNRELSDPKDDNDPGLAFMGIARPVSLLHKNTQTDKAKLRDRYSKRVRSARSFAEKVP